MSKNTIRRQFEPLSSETLLDIQNKNDREYFSDNVFEVISEILADRNPKPVENSTSQDNGTQEVGLDPSESTNHGSSIWVMGIIIFILGILFIISFSPK